MAHPLDGFQGYAMPGYTQIPDELLDAQLHILSHAELKVLLYIMRHTFGYKRDGDHLSARQISEGITRRDGTRVDHGTGCAIATVRRTVQRLEAVGLIVVHREQSDDSGDASNYYAIRIADGGGCSQDTPRVSPGHPPGCSQDTPPGVPATPTIYKTSRKKTSRDKNISQGDGLADAFFAAIGEEKPSRKRRERASEIIQQLTDEGFSPDTLRLAIDLAAERGARGPDLLPHVVGEAHTMIQARASRVQQSAAIAAAGDETSAAGDATIAANLAAIDQLEPAARDQLEAQARAALPANMSEGMIRAVLPGLMAAQLRGQP